MQCISTYKLNILFQCANNESWKNAEIGIQSPLFMHSNWFSINQPQHMYDVHKYIFTLFAYGFCIRFFIIQWNDDVIIRFYILVCYSHSHSHSIRMLILVSVVSPNKVKKKLEQTSIYASLIHMPSGFQIEIEAFENERISFYWNAEKK